MSTKRGSLVGDYYNSPLFNTAKQFSNTPSANQERAIQSMLERNIAELAMNRFKYENLPESVPERFIELCMLYNGLVVWYWDFKFDKLLAVRGSGQGYVNFNDEPVSFNIIGPGTNIQGMGKELAFMPKILSAYLPASDGNKSDAEKRKKAVPMWPNILRIPDFDIVSIYSRRLAVTDRTLEINTKNARRNRVVTASPNQQLSLTNLVRQQDEGVEVIQVTGAANPDATVSTLDLGILPDSYEKISILRSRWWNECMGLLGIDNANQDKKERLVEAEVGANDAQTDSMRFVALNARRQALKHINEIFDQNIKVDYNVEVEAQAKQMAETHGITQIGSAA